MHKETLYLLLPVRDVVVFPHSVVPLFVKREQSIQTLKKAYDSGDCVLIATQLHPKVDLPKKSDLYKVGTLSRIVQLAQLADGSIKALLEGKKRAEVIDVLIPDDRKHPVEAYGKDFETLKEDEQEIEAMRRIVLTELDRFSKIQKRNDINNMASLSQIKDTEKMLDIIVPHLSMEIEIKQALLQEQSLDKRLSMLFNYLSSEIEVAQVQKRIWGRVKNDFEKQQREHVLQMQRKAIENELNDLDGSAKSDILELEKRVIDTPFPEEAMEKALSEIKKLKGMNPMSSEASVVRNYIDWLLALPWEDEKIRKFDLLKVEKILHEDHYGLFKVKEKILEFLAVQCRTGRPKGSVLCLLGPPGVGKTSLARSIARAIGRPFVKISMGGIKDEAIVRGHRRTYVGSVPGNIIQGMKKAKSKNALMALDELDKIGQDWRGDPSDALLEVLDSEQNREFMDHYLEIGYDLSKVMFICTANSMNFSPALHDRLEIIRISGYTEDEKVEIARRHLLPRQKSENGLKPKEFSINDEAIRILIRNHCREAGVRGLEREIASIARKSVKKIILHQEKNVDITENNIEKYAGSARYHRSESDLEDKVGTTTGLAWTEAGGETLSIESVMLPGKGVITATGKLGDVMKESVQAASSFIKSRASDYGIDSAIFEKNDIHVHIPEGATPKDGPSAGIALCTSIVSLLTKCPVRGNIAMTGEISLRGKILPIGGLKEKILAAHRFGIKTVFVPADNKKDLEDIPIKIMDEMNISLVSSIDDVLKGAIVNFKSFK